MTKNQNNDHVGDVKTPLLLPRGFGVVLCLAAFGMFLTPANAHEGTRRAIPAEVNDLVARVATVFAGRNDVPDEPIARVRPSGRLWCQCRFVPPQPAQQLVVDRDPFEINQLGHPYQGSVYFGLARSNGLSFWESLGFAFAGSAVWEVAGETTTPSRNDQITTSFGGSFLGESLYRMANLVLEQGYGLSPGSRLRQLNA